MKKKTGTKTVAKKKISRKRVSRVVKKENVISLGQYKMPKEITVDVIPCTQNGVTFYSTVLDADLMRMMKFDIYDHKSGTGHNRQIGDRGRKFYKFIKEVGAFCPVGIVVNDRENGCVVRKVNGRYRMTIDTSTPLWIIEGQGRVDGFLLMLEGGQSTEVPISITKGDFATEVKTAWTINHERTSVAGNMKVMNAWQIVLDAIRNKVPMKNIDPYQLRQSVAYDVICRMNDKRGSLFYKMFVMPNEKTQSISMRKNKIKKNPNDKTATHNLITVSAHTRVEHIQKIVKMVMESSQYKSFNKLCDAVAEIVFNFWEAFEEVNPTVFTNPKPIIEDDKKMGRRRVLLQGYHTQGRNGCFVMYPMVVQMIKRGITSKRQFKKYFSKSEILKDVDFWIDDKTLSGGIRSFGDSTHGKIRAKILREMGLGI